MTYPTVSIERALEDKYLFNNVTLRREHFPSGIIRYSVTYDIGEGLVTYVIKDASEIMDVAYVARSCWYFGGTRHDVLELHEDFVPMAFILDEDPNGIPENTIINHPLVGALETIRDNRNAIVYVRATREGTCRDCEIHFPGDSSIPLIDLGVEMFEPLMRYLKLVDFWKTDTSEHFTYRLNRSVIVPPIYEHEDIPF